MSGIKLVDARVVPAGDPEAPSELREPDQVGQAVGTVVREVPAPIGPGDPTLLAGAAITVVDDGQRVAPLVAALLESHGARARVVESDEIPSASDGIIHLGQLHAAAQVASDLLKDVYPVAMAGATTVLAVTGLGGMHGQSIPDSVVDGAGTTALFGALAEALPGTNVRAVDVDSSDDPVVLAGRIVAEALDAAGPVAVGYRDDRRCALVSTDPSMVREDPDQRVDWSIHMKPVTIHGEAALLLMG